MLHGAAISAADKGVDSSSASAVPELRTLDLNENRYSMNGDIRTCNWCGAKHQRTVETKIIEEQVERFTPIAARRNPMETEKLPTPIKFEKWCAWNAAPCS